MLNKIAFYQGRRDEIPNQELAKELAQKEDKDGIQEIADNLWNENKSIQSDCIKVLYSIGYLKPILIADYIKDFLKLLNNKNNRMVWGSMIALETISLIKHEDIWMDIDNIIETIKKGTVITQVWGIKLLANLSTINTKYHTKLYPILFDYLRDCRPIDFPTRTETLLKVLNDDNFNEFNNIINNKKDELKDSQLKRLNKILKNQDYVKYTNKLN